MNYTPLMDLVSAISSRLAASGAETYRVEECVRRITAAYGLEARVYAVPHSLFISILIPGRDPLTQLCRMYHQCTDLEAVERYSNLSRRICAERPDWETALEWVAEAQASQKHYPMPVDLIGHVLVACGFCVFFGGGWREFCAAGLCG